MKKPKGLLEREYYEIMKTISRSAIGVAEQALRDKEDYCAYVESWIHEIKTPLTACSLILANGADTRKLRRELKKCRQFDREHSLLCENEGGSKRS